MISFNQIPSAVRTPFAFVEFDASESSTGSSIQPYKLLLIGQKLSSGTAAEGVPVRVASESQAAGLFGTSSMLTAMVRKSLAANNFTETWAVPLADNGGGVAAASTLVVTGPATSDGTISLYVGDELISVPVLSGDTAITIASDIADAITDSIKSPISAVVDSGSTSHVLLAYKHKGLAGNAYPVQLNFNGETLPLGVGVTIPAFTGGTTNPDITPALEGLGDEQFRTIVMPYLDPANLTLIENYLGEKWGPLYTNDGHAFAVTNAPSATASTLGLSRNSPHLTIMENIGSSTPNYETAAVLGATVAFNSPIDPARPLQTLELKGVTAPKLSDRLILQERNVLLYSGIATSYVDAGGKVRIERLITTYKENALGAPDEAYLDYETLAILSYLRYDFRNFFQTRYPRHKLAAPGTRFAAGQAVITPTDAKAEAIGLFVNWEAAGLVEDADQFARDLIVEKSTTNPNRLDFYLPPNLINGLRILAAKFAFRQ
jgi:phage tail sheath gpL-like